MKKESTKPIGNLGEDIAERYLRERNYTIQERNYLKKWGEIDIIATKEGIIHFVEVKAARVENVHKTHNDTYQPEEKITTTKLRRLERAIGTYLIERRINDETPFQIDALVVFLDVDRKIARCRMTENVVLE